MNGPGLYIHVPFCHEKCPYCDFYSVRPDEYLVSSYLSALGREMDRRGARASLCYSTIYIGGGSPTFRRGLVERIMEMVYHYLIIRPGAEVTCESNPDLTQDLAQELKAAGVNRLSLGLQSLDDGDLERLGRRHTAAQCIKSLDVARRAGFDNISVDLMYGVPEQSVSSFRQTLRAVLALSPEHVSAYALKIEEGTPFGENPPLPGDECQAEMYELLLQETEDHGYVQYEISNFAQSGFECRHNINYWKNGEYLGLGPGAHSHLKNRRSSNPRSIQAYVASDFETEPGGEDLTSGQILAETVMLGLRMIEGIDVDEIKRRCGQDIRTTHATAISKAVEHGLARFDGTRFALTRKGLLLANQVMLEFME
ncbi:MAG: radical SAM family heme chaperone HemW [Bacillota bacterium]